MNIKEIKKLSEAMNGATHQLEFIRSFCDVLEANTLKEKDVNDKSISLYINLIEGGALANISKQLELLAKATNEADEFIYTVAQQLDDKKIVNSAGGDVNE